MPHRTQFGRYELLRKIAAGGMAELYLARQWGDGGFFRDVVIKRLFPHMAEHPRTLEMFQYEARLIAHLAHPNIPQVFELGFVDNRWFMAMEFVDGNTVADVWRQGARSGYVMPLPVAVGLTLQICEALHHAHERRDRAGQPLRIVHRDVTPHNAMVTQDGVVKLMDFGVAQTAARKDTEAGAVKGTFSYMAPEQVRAKPLDKRADVFALAVILYELTTGTRLYRGNDVQIMTQIVEQDAPRPSARVANYPPDLEEVVMAGLRRDRSQRIPSAAHVALALEDFAVRRGLLIGPRALARYYTQVFPYQRTKEMDVAMVAPEAAEVFEVFPNGDDTADWAPVGNDGDDVVDLMPVGESLDDPSIADDLALLEPEPSGRLAEGASAAHRVPEAHDGPGVHRGAEVRALEPHNPLEPHNHLEPHNAHSAPSTIPPAAPDALTSQGFEGILGDVPLDDETMDGELEALPGFEEELGDRPVVLLDQPKREGKTDGDYLRDLERRLEADD